MTTTKKKNKMLHSLKEIGHLNCNNGYKSAIKVEITPGLYKTIKVYSILMKQFSKPIIFSASSARNYLIENIENYKEKT